MEDKSLSQLLGTVADWHSFDDDWPTDPKESIILYNAHLGIWDIHTMDGVESSYRRLMQNYAFMSDLCEGDQSALTYLENRYRYTHWAPLPSPPDFP